MELLVGVGIFCLVSFVSGFAVGYGERQKQEVREKARRFEKLRDAAARASVREHFAARAD